MSTEDQTRWNRRYGSGDYVPRDEPTPFLLRWLDHVPRGPALDVASGTGRNALALAAAGFEVDAVDISTVALERARSAAAGRGLDVNWVVADLDAAPLPRRHYALVAVLRYRDPALWPRLVAALAPDGWIVVEHHLRTDRDDVRGPRHDAFRLAPGELLRAFGGLRIVHYSEGVEPADRGDGRYCIARLAACAGDPGW